MEEQDNQIDNADFEEDRTAEENHEVDEFLAVMIQVLNDNMPIRVIQALLDNAPPISLEEWYFLATCDESLRHPIFLQMLLEHEPKIARYEDPYSSNGFLLHHAIINEESVDAIELIRDAYPEAISKKNRNGYLPLHLACYKQSFQTAELLLSRYPSAAGVSSEKEREYPLLFCLRHIKMNYSEGFIMALVEAYPGAASDNRGSESALYFACLNGYSLSIVQRLCQLYPEALTVHTGPPFVALPLHAACRRSPVLSVEVIKFLLEEYSEGAQSKSHSGQLPLHYLCAAKDASLEAIQILIGTYPNAVNITDNLGKLPLHMACRHGASLEIIQLLLEAYPNAVRVTTNDRKLPLHYACTNGASLEVLQLLLDHFVGDEQKNNGLGVADVTGKLPIHGYVRSGNARPETLQYLLGLCPAGIHAVDNEGMLPLHWACGSNHPVLEVIRFLVEGAPFTVTKKCAGGKTPIEIAWSLKNRSVVGVVEYLLERQNGVVLAMKEAFEDVADTQLGLPDLVIANIWSFARPKLWAPNEEDWEDLYA